MDETLEYLFFTRRVADEFIQALQARTVAYVEEMESVQDAIVLKISEAMDEDLWDELDTLYDELSEQDQVLMEQGLDDKDAKSSAGIYLQLAGGKQTIAAIDPDVMNRMLAVITMDEFNAFVETIVSSVEVPDDSAICKRV